MITTQELPTVKLSMQVMCAAATLAAGLAMGSPVAWAFGDAPWCAVISLGAGTVYWDCQYRTFEACYPNVLAGNRGFCNVNPWPEPAFASAVVHPRHLKKYARHH